MAFLVLWRFYIIQHQITPFRLWFKNWLKWPFGQEQIILQLPCGCQVTHCLLPRMKHFVFKTSWPAWLLFSHLSRYPIVLQALPSLSSKNELWRPSYCRLVSWLIVADLWCDNLCYTRCDHWVVSILEWKRVHLGFLTFSHSELLACNCGNWFMSCRWWAEHPRLHIGQQLMHGTCYHI